MRAQVIFTATQFDNSDRVLFWLDGEPIEFFGGEGLILDEPQARMNVERSFTGGVIIDTPALGANGEQIGGVAPVSAGAWGMWADFETTITLDASAGPIELVGYDEGGWGTDPGCPPVIRTIVPLVFTG